MTVSEGIPERIVFVCPDFPVAAGGSTYVENMGLAFRAQGAAVSVLSLYDGDHPSELPHETILGDRCYFTRPLSGGRHGLTRVKSAPEVLRKRWRRRRGLRRAARRLHGLDRDSLVVFTHVHALIALKEGGFDPRTCRALVVGQHHSPFASLELEPLLLRQIRDHFRDVDLLTALSEEDATGFEALTGTLCWPMPNPVPASTPHPYDKQGRICRLISLARFTPEKRLPLMAALAGQALSDANLSGWSFALFGDGPEKALVEATAAESPVHGRIVLPGRTSVPLEELRRSRIHLVTSAYEGFSLTTLEAATQGVPTIAFDVSPGLRELMTTLGGVLVPDGDTEGFVDQLRRLMKDAEEWDRRSASAVEGARAYSGPAVVEKWADMLSSAHAQDLRSRSGITRDGQRPR